MVTTNGAKNEKTAIKVTAVSEQALHGAAPLASIRQMSRQVSRGSAGEYQADEQAVVARLRWRVSGR